MKSTKFQSSKYKFQSSKNRTSDSCQNRQQDGQTSRVRLLVVMHVRDGQVVVILSWVVHVDLKSFFQSDSTVEMASIITRDINNPA